MSEPMLYLGKKTEIPELKAKEIGIIYAYVLI
jgi:hypothetical protein